VTTKQPFLVDTDVISETTKPRPHPAVIEWLADQAEIFVSAVTVFELARGIERVPAGKKREFLEAWFVELLQAAVGVLPFDVGSAIAAARLEADRRRSGRAIDTRDLFILASAKAKGAPLATRNVAHFKGFGVEVYDPFTAHAAH
jgi:predicted nucleic acid-binding protein